MTVQEKISNQENAVTKPYSGPLLSLQDLHVWYELRRFGFGHAGYVRAVDGVSFDLEQGQAIAIVDGELCVAADSSRAAVRASVARMLSEDSGLITLYYGEDVTREEAQALADDLAQEHPSLEVELVSGGQPHYTYIVSVE